MRGSDEGGRKLSDEEKTYIVRLSGKELKVVTGKVKGRIQDQIKNTHRFNNAQYLTYRNEGSIRVDGVSESVLRDALQRAQNNLLPEFRFTFEITELREGDELREPDDEREADLESEIDRRFQIGIEQAQKEWDRRAKGYESEISRLAGDISSLERYRDQLIRLNDQEKERNASLQKSYSELSSLASRLSAERIRPPVDASRLWVGDWSRIADKFESGLRETGFTGKIKEVADLLNYDLPAVTTATKSLLPPGVEMPTDFAGIESFSKSRPWEDTDEFRTMSADYARAMAEIDYVTSVASGKIQMPDSLKETFLKSVNVEGNKRIVSDFESHKHEYHKKNAAASEISELIGKYKAGESMRALRANMIREKPLPAVLTCQREDAKWILELLLPESKGFVKSVYEECVEKACDEAGLREPEITESENLVSVRAKMSGNVQTWKEASRKQEQLAASLMKSFRACPLQMLGTQLRLTKMMDVPAPSDRPEIFLPSHDEDEEIGGIDSRPTQS